MFTKDISDLIPAFSEYLQEHENAPSTISKYVHDVRSLQHYAEAANAAKITKEIVISYKNHLTIHYKPASFNSMLIAVNLFFTWQGIPQLKVKTVRIQRTDCFDTMFTRKEYELLLEVAKRYCSERVYLVMRVLASTGIRVGEIQFITAEAGREGKATVWNKGKIRDIFIPVTVCEELLGYCERKGIVSGIVFHGKKTDKMLDKSQIWRDLKMVSDLAGLPSGKVHAQNFRHLFAKEYITKYNNVCDLADILGHNSIETTRIYTRTSSVEKQERVNGLNL